MATRRSSKKPTMVAETAPAPLPKAPQTMVPETEDGEWEEVLLCSYTPMPVVWDEHPTAQKLEKLLQGLHFRVHTEPSEHFNHFSKCISFDKHSLTIVPPVVFSHTPVINFTRKPADYESTAQSHRLLAGLKLDENRKLFATSPSGKFTIGMIVRLPGVPTAWLWRLDFGSDEPTKLLEVPAQEPLFPENFESYAQNMCGLWVSDSYAYFSCRDLVFRVDVRTGERSLVFEAETKPYNLGLINRISYERVEFLDTLHMAQLGKGIVAVLSTLKGQNEPRRLRMIQERTNTVLKTVDGKVGIQNFWCQYALLREGLVVKFNTGSKGQAGLPRFQNHYSLYRLDNLQPVTKHVVDNSCQYSKNWFSINYFRITGFPVFIEAVFIDRQKYFFSLSVLFRSRFHNLTCPCPIDMRNRLVSSILTPVQHDQRLTELVVCVKKLHSFEIDSINVLRMRI